MLVKLHKVLHEIYSSLLAVAIFAQIVLLSESPLGSSPSFCVCPVKLCKDVTATSAKLTLKVNFLLEVLLQRLLAVVVLCVFWRHLGLRLGWPCRLVFPQSLWWRPSSHRCSGFGFFLEIGNSSLTILVDGLSYCGFPHIFHIISLPTDSIFVWSLMRQAAGGGWWLISQESIVWRRYYQTQG